MQMANENNTTTKPYIVKNETILGDAREFCEQQKLEEIKSKKYLDPLYDAAFKAFLNDEQALVCFLNGVFMNGIRKLFLGCPQTSPMRSVLSANPVDMKFRLHMPFGFAISLSNNKMVIVVTGQFAMRRA